MLDFKIIEDCSPFYIKFYHSSTKPIIDKCKHIINTLQLPEWTFNNHKLPMSQGEEIVSLLPLDLNFNLKRVSLFVTGPGYYYQAHKDGLDHRFSINYGIEISDDKCVTSWYDDNDLNNYEIEYFNGKSRECNEFIKHNHIPLKSMTLQEGEALLFNTDIFHDFDNSLSNHRRIVLTLRINRPGRTYFDDAKELIFGIKKCL